MNKKKIAITIFVSIILIVVVGCSDINPFFAGGVVPGGNWIYFAEANNIKRMCLDGSEVESVFTVSYVDIQRIQLDPFQQKIYILNVNPAPLNSSIYEYTLDGKDEKRIIDKDSVFIYDMKIDSAAGILYYFDDAAAVGNIRQIELEIGKSSDIYVTAATTAFSMSPDFSGNLYYTHGTSLNKLNISAKSSSVITPLTPALVVPGGVAFDRGSGNVYLYDNDGTDTMFEVKKIIPSIPSSTDIYNDTPFIYSKNVEISSIDNKMFFYHDNVSTFELYSLNLDGSGLKQIYSSQIGGFDILSK